MRIMLGFVGGLFVGFLTWGAIGAALAPSIAVALNPDMDILGIDPWEPKPEPRGLWIVPLAVIVLTLVWGIGGAWLITRRRHETREPEGSDGPGAESGPRSPELRSSR